MLEELRVNPRSPGARLRGRRPGAGAGSGGTEVHPSLSTGCPEARSRRLHSEKEGVG